MPVQRYGRLWAAPAGYCISPCHEGQYDMARRYRDRGHIPLKLLGFMMAREYHRGLPFIRPADHGNRI